MRPKKFRELPKWFQEELRRGHEKWMRQENQRVMTNAEQAIEDTGRPED
jgi:hypothetical protein